MFWKFAVFAHRIRLLSFFNKTVAHDLTYIQFSDLLHLLQPRVTDHLLQPRSDAVEMKLASLGIMWAPIKCPSETSLKITALPRYWRVYFSYLLQPRSDAVDVELVSTGEVGVELASGGRLQTYGALAHRLCKIIIF